MTDCGAAALRRDPGGMVHLPAGPSAWGRTRITPRKRPPHLVTVDPFWIDVTPVTNRQFAAFVAATGHRTTAEIAPRAEDYPGACRTCCGPGR
jgi:formylglycine-generating enzyme